MPVKLAAAPVNSPNVAPVCGIRPYIFAAALVKKGAAWYNTGMKLIMFCDYGLDDAAATNDMLRHAEGYDGVDLVAVGGNVPPEVALANGAKLLAALGCDLSFVRLVDTTAERQPYEFLKDIHGDDGMGDLFAKAPSPVPVVRYSDWLKEEREQFDLLSLGPMTLVQPLLERDTPRRFVFMGGNISEIPNFHGYEFNHALDRAAFSACVKAPHVAITMDTCRNPLLNIQEKALEGNSLAVRLVNRSREMTFRSGEKGCYVWDDMAVKYLRHPEWFTVKEETDRDGNRLTVAEYVLGQTYPQILEK